MIKYYSDPPERTLCVCESVIGEECRLTLKPSGLSGWFLGRPRSQMWIDRGDCKGPNEPHIPRLIWDFPDDIPPCATDRINRLYQAQDMVVLHRTVPECHERSTCEDPQDKTMGAACDFCTQVLDSTDSPVDGVGRSTIQEHIQYRPESSSVYMPTSILGREHRED